MKTEPNRIEAVLKVKIAGEFYDDDASEETLRFAVEQDLEDAGFDDVEVSVVRESEWVKMHGMMIPELHGYHECKLCGYHQDYHNRETLYPFCPLCGARMKNSKQVADNRPVTKGESTSGN